MNKRMQGLAAFGLLMLGGSSVEAYAAQGRQGDGPEVRERAIEEITVTAQRREQSMQDVPITMSAFTGEQFRERGVVDTRDLDKMVPGFKYAETGFNVPVFTLRGIGFDDESQTASGTVGLYIDEFNLPFPIMAKGPNVDLQRIEVLKGPQGTLYGINTTAGAINYISSMPTDRFEMGFSGGYGRFETSDLEGYVSGPVTDHLGMRLAVRQIRSSEGWQKSLTRPNGPEGELGELDKLSGRYTLEWHSLNSLSAVLSVDGWRDKSHPQAAAPVAIVPANPNLGEGALSPRVREHPTVPFSTKDMRLADWPLQTEEGVPKWQLDDRFVMGRLRLDWDALENATLSYLGSYGEFKSDESGVPTSGLGVPNLEGAFDVRTTFSANELRWSGDWGSDVYYNLGVFVGRSNVSQDWDSLWHTSSAAFPHDANGNSFFMSAINIARQKSETDAVFLNLEWQFTPTLRASVGARYTEEKRNFKGCTWTREEDTTPPRVVDVFNAISVLEGGSGGAGAGECLTLDEETRDPGLVVKTLKEDNTSSRAALDWAPRDDFLFYLSYSRGFKAGSFPSFGAGEGKQFDPVTQERLDAWELGGKLGLLDGSVQLNFAGFHYDYRDKQLMGSIEDPVFGVLNMLVNAPKSRVMGGEVEVQATPVRDLDIYLSAVYLDTEVREYTGINDQGQEVDFSGNRFNHASRWSGTTGVSYRRPLPIVDSLEVAVGVDYSYVESTNSALSGDPLFALRSYQNVDYRFRIGHSDRSWGITFWGRNVTNEYQPVSARRTGGSDAVARYARMPQTYGVSFHYDYR